MEDPVDQNASTEGTDDALSASFCNKTTEEAPHRIVLTVPSETPKKILDRLPKTILVKPVGDAFTMGRGEGSDITLNDAKMSRSFASISSRTTSNVEFLLTNCSKKSIQYKGPQERTKILPPGGELVLESEMVFRLLDVRFAFQLESVGDSNDVELEVKISQNVRMDPVNSHLDSNRGNQLFTGAMPPPLQPLRDNGMLPRGFPCAPQMQHMSPQIQRMAPHIQHIEPQVQYMASQLQHMSPQIQRMAPHIQHIEPQIQYMASQLQHMALQNQQRTAHIQHTGPHIQHIGPQLQHVTPHQQMEPLIQHMTPHQQMAPHIQHMTPQNQQMAPYVQQTEPQMQQMGPQIQNIPSQIQNIPPQIQNMAPGMVLPAHQAYQMPPGHPCCNDQECPRREIRQPEDDTTGKLCLNQPLSVEHCDPDGQQNHVSSPGATPDEGPQTMVLGSTGSDVMPVLDSNLNYPAMRRQSGAENTDVKGRDDH